MQCVLQPVCGSATRTDQMETKLQNSNGYEKLNKATIECPFPALQIVEGVDMDLINGPIDKNEDIPQTNGENIAQQ